MLSMVNILRPVERVINPSSPNGFLAEYHRKVPMIIWVRLDKSAAIASMPTGPIKFARIYSIWRFFSYFASTFTSTSPILQLSELFKLLQTESLCKIKQITDGLSSYNIDG
jgi:hypothetical protein